MLSRTTTLALGIWFLASASYASTIRTHFPYTSQNVGFARQSRPVIADLGLSSGHRQIIFGTSGPLPSGTDPGGKPTAGGYLFVVMDNGTIASGFPVQLPAEVNTVAIGDLNGDGVGDVIVVGYGSTFDGTTLTFPGGIRAYNTNGTVRWDRPGKDFNGDGIPRAVYATPAIADVDGDGKQEVAWGGYDGWVYLADLSTGADKSGWPIFLKDTISSSPALFDINGDGKKEIIIGSAAHGGGENVLGYPTPYGGCLWVFTAGGGVQPGFPYCIGEVIDSSPAVGDINGDGLPEIVFGTAQYLSDPANPNFSQYHLQHKVFAITRTGQDVSGWPFQLANNEEVNTSPALGDLNGDGIPEVLVTTFRQTAYQCASPCPSDVRSRLYAINGNGTQYGVAIPQTSDSTPKTTYNGQDPIVADVYSDGKPEVLVPYGFEVATFDSSASLNQLTSATGPLEFNVWGPVNAVATGQIDNGGAEDVVVAASGDSVNGVNVNETAVTAWDLKGSPSAPMWGFFHQSTDRVGVFPGTPVPPPITGTTPTISSISPTSGPASGGTSVTINGGNFLAGAIVSFGGLNATSTSFASSSKLTAISPAYPAAVVDVTVTNPDSGFATLTKSFTFIAVSSKFYSVSPPCRAADTRNASGTLGGPSLAAGQTRTFPLTNVCGVPSTAKGISLNITVADATTAGNLRLYPGTEPAPLSNAISFVPGSARANNVTVGLTGGVVTVLDEQTSGTANLIIDINGYYQ